MVTSQPVSYSYNTDGETITFPLSSYYIGLLDRLVEATDSSGNAATQSSQHRLHDRDNPRSKAPALQLIFGSAPATGGTVTITGSTSVKVPFTANSILPTGVHEEAVDRFTLNLQEL